MFPTPGYPHVVFAFLWRSPMDILVVVIVFVLLFGGKKIPELAKGLGEGIKHFKSAIKDDDKDEKKND
jgi:sec-independent protein translocase protein TatA